MKKLALILGLVLVSFSVLAQSGTPVYIVPRQLSQVAPPSSMTFSNVSVMLLPDRTIQSAVTWTNYSVNAQGSVVSCTNRLYWAATGGTSGANAPSGMTNTTSGTTVWKWIPTGPRSGCTIVNYGTADMYLSIGWPATTNAGVYLVKSGGSMCVSGSGCPQVAIYGVSASTASVGLLDW